MTPDSGCGPLLQQTAAKTPPLRQQIFEHVRAAGRVARADIARALQISAGSATTLTADLIVSGVLREVDAQTRDAGRGRPPVALEVVPEATLVIGIVLSFKRHSAVICDFAGNVVATMTLAVSDNRRSAAKLLDEIMALIARLLDHAGIAAPTIRAVGIGLPGLVDQAGGMIRWCSLIHDVNVDFAALFAARFHAPLFLDNDTNMLTLAELWFGVGRNRTDFAVVTIQNGVGMGLVVNNQLYRGTHGIGLELGHTKVQLDGALCRCGQRGCLEAYLGDYAMVREAATALDQGDAVAQSAEDLLHQLFEQAKAGNAAAETIFKRAGRYLSVALSNVIQLFDPPLIILSGHRAQYDYFYADEVMADMQRMTLSQGRKPCEIQIHPWDDLVWARGATVPALIALTDRIVGGVEA